MTWLRTGPHSLPVAAMFAVLLLSVIVVASGCTSSKSPTRQKNSASGFSLRAPTCSVEAADQPTLVTPQRTFTSVAGSPWGIAATEDGRWAFASQNATDQLAVLSLSGLSVKLRREIALPTGPAAGETITADGRYLLVAAGDGTVVIDTADAEKGRRHSILGVLSMKGGEATEVATSRDGRFAFVTLELTREVAVFNLAAALADHFRSQHLIGTVTLGRAVAGIAVSPDGRWIYATSEIAAGPITPHTQGTVTVLDERRAEIAPAASIVATAAAGCAPVRVVASSSEVWVAARGSNELVEFSASKLRTDPRHAILARIQVGQAPVGLALVDRGQRIVVADSNRFLVAGAGAKLTVIDIPPRTGKRPSVVGSVPTGEFPRDLASSGNGTELLVSDFGSNQVEVVATTSLPRRLR